MIFLKKRSSTIAAMTCFLLLGGYGGETPAAQEGSLDFGHAKMEKILAEIGERSALENEYFGLSEVAHFNKFFAEADPQKDPGKYLRILTELGASEVSADRIADGLAHLKQAYEMMSKMRVPPSISAYVAHELGVAYLRLGETENCCSLNVPESCILPLRGAAIHTKREGSESALRYLLQASESEGADLYLRLESMWLLNLAYMTLGEYPDKVPAKFRLPESTFQSRLTFPRFPNQSAALGIDTDTLAGGAVMDDFDGDHDLDLIVSNWNAAEPMHYFDNRLGEGFTDNTEAAGLSRMLGGLNLVQADYDNDGDIDLFVMRGAWLGSKGEHPNSLLQNQGDGTFRDVTFEVGLGEPFYPTQTAGWADYDLDGDLDLFIGNESSRSLAVPCQLFQNTNGHFIDVAAAAGVTNNQFTKGVTWGDVDGDRWPDLVISNYETLNRLYRNNRDGTFTDIAASAGVENPKRSFPTWTWDFNNDGNLDIFIGTYSGRTGDLVQYYLGRPSPAEPSGHYQGDGKGHFVDVAKAQGVDMPFQVMGCNFGDLNNDGFLDFYIGTGEPNISTITPNIMYLNRGGKGFDDISMVGGFSHLQKGHGVVFADPDQDGDIDVFEQLGGARKVDHYRDAFFANPGFGNHWLMVRLTGTRSNRSGIGARVHARILENGQERSIYRWMGGGSSFGGNPLAIWLGLGKATEVKSLEVYWPMSDLTQRFEHVAGDRSLVIEEGNDKIVEVPYPVLNLVKP